MLDNSTEKKDFVTIKEVAASCGISYGTVRRDIEQGKLKGYRIGRKFLIAYEDFENYLKNWQYLKAIDGYSVNEIMTMIPVSYGFLMEKIKTGQIKATKVGRQYMVKKADFTAFLEENKLNN